MKDYVIVVIVAMIFIHNNIKNNYNLIQKMSDLLQYISSLESDEGVCNNRHWLGLLENAPILEISRYLKNTYNFIELVSYNKYEIMFKIENPIDEDNLLEILELIIDNNTSGYSDDELKRLKYLAKSSECNKFDKDFK